MINALDKSGEARTDDASPPCSRGCGDRDLPTDATRADVACAVARVYPAFEIIETRGDLSGQLALAITDNGQQKAFVLGEPVSRDALPELDVVTVRVRINGTEVATASGDAVLARPRGGLAPENQVRTGLPAGGSRIRTLGPPASRCPRGEFFQF